MTFEEILDQAIAMLQRRGRLTYGALKRQFSLDDAYLEDVKNELIEGQWLAVDEAGRVLVWTGTPGLAAASPAASAAMSERAPLAYTPPYLAEKILTSRSALEGERKQVTVLFADLKGSTELIRDLDPETAQHLLDPALPLMEQAVEAATSVRLGYSLSLTGLSEAYVLAGRLEEASQLALRALEFSRAHKERGQQAYALRLLGDIAVRREIRQVELAEDYYRQARALTDELGMRPLQAHCHRGLGTLYAQLGQREQACAALSMASEMYKSMDMTFWLPQTEAALAQVEGR